MLNVFIIAICLSVITVIADIFVKNASMQNGFAGYKLLIAGSLVYALTAFGWFFVIRRIKLSTSGAIYAVSCIILLTFVSIFIYNEKINSLEVIGIILAIVSLLLLSRFS